ncbi:MAG: putative bifunctional diguanylate cyclase/phosphodiesterase [Actinomycetota bacterium]
MTTDDNEPASVDALTARGGFLADVGMADGDHISGLPQRHRELEARYRGIIERLPAVLYIDGVGDGDTMVDVGPGIVDLLGLTREEWLATPEAWRDVLHPGDLDRIVEASDRTAATGEPFREQYRAIHRDGHEVWVREEAVRVEDADGNPQFWLGLMLDVTDSVRTERELLETRTKYGALVEHIPAIVYVDLADERMTTSYVSPQIEAILGITPQEYMDDPDMWVTHLHPDDREETVAAYVEGRGAGEPFTLEYRLVARDGRVLWFSDSAVVVHDPTGEPLYVQGVMLDITKRKEAEEQIAFLAYHDKLTGLPNRVLFDELLELSLARARRHGLGVSVISLDIDNFKLVNDSLGHEAGDELIVLLSERLREATRETDLVARPGGDEFLMLLADLEPTSILPGGDPAALVAESVASRIHASLQQPFEVAGTELYVTASLGISLFPNHGDDAETLLKHADNAMFRSKQAGPSGSFMHAAGDVDAMGKLSLSTRLRKAVENQSWMLHYQPLIDLSTGGMIGVEALIRWPEPGGGLIQPGEFIPLAEEMGLIEAIGDWVVEELSRQDAMWRADGLTLEISFNLSPRQLWQPDVVDKISSRLRSAGMDPARLTVEITESTAMTDPDRTQTILEDMHGRGLRLAIDDFGTGYSSLARLKHMPVDVLKIDRSFIRDVDTDRDAASMVSAMIALADNLGMIALAEGIETEAEWRFLADHGCALGQGYYFSRPVPADEILALHRRAALTVVQGGGA